MADQPCGVGAKTLLRNWAFERSEAAPRAKAKRALSWLRGRGAPPAWQILKPLTPAVRWNTLFLYLPHGTLDADQHEILSRLRRLEGAFLIVCATPSGDVPEVLHQADALICKELRGFDFSAYRIALESVAAFSPGAIVYLQNDSVLGPFGDLDALVNAAPWDLTGFMGAAAVENHISSFAFIVRDVTKARLDAMHPVLSKRWSCDRFDDVILLQETRLARIAARTMSVGSFWHLPDRPSQQPLIRRVLARLGGSKAQMDFSGDGTLACPIDLLHIGFPYLKRSLFTKFAGLHSEKVLRQALREHGWYNSQPYP